MRSSNPIFTRSATFSNHGQRAHYAQRGMANAYAPDYYDAEEQGSAGLMTLDDVIAKTGILMLIMAVTAAATWVMMPPQFLYGALIISSLVGFVTAMVVSLRRTLSVPVIFAYAVVEGIFVGSFSVIVERGLNLPGVVTQAVLGTIVAAGLTLAAYKYLGVRVRGRLAKIVVISIVAFAVVMLINLVLALAGVNTGLAAIGAAAGPIAYLAAGVGVVLAVASLLMDFDYIEDGIRNGAPESESWRGAFGLLVTMVWLYINILRIISYFRD